MSLSGIVIPDMSALTAHSEAQDDVQAIRRLDQISNGIVGLSVLLGSAAAFAIPASAGFGVFGLAVQWRLVVGALALAVLALRGPVLSFRQRFFHADHIIG